MWRRRNVSPGEDYVESNMSRLLHETVERSTARRTVVRASGQNLRAAAIKTGKTMKRTLERRSNAQIRKEPTAEARARNERGTAAGERPAGGPAAASRATGTTSRTSNQQCGWHPLLCAGKNAFRMFERTRHAVPQPPHIFRILRRSKTGTEQCVPCEVFCVDAGVPVQTDVGKARGFSRYSDPSSDWPNSVSCRAVL